MTKFLQILLIACIAVAVCSAEAPRSRFRVASRYQQQQRRTRVLARQEVAPVDEQEAVTPYPSADELKPEVPFDEVANADLPTPPEEDVAAEEIAPVDEAERQPDAIYGPPETEADAVAVPDDDSQVVDAPEDTVDADQEETNVAADEQLEVEEQVQSQRLVNGRRAFGRKSVRPAKLRQARPAKLVKASRKVQRSARIQQQQPLEPQAFATQPLFFYTAPYQGW